MLAARAARARRGGRRGAGRRRRRAALRAARERGAPRRRGLRARVRRRLGAARRPAARGHGPARRASRASASRRSASRPDPQRAAGRRAAVARRRPVGDRRRHRHLAADLRRQVPGPRRRRQHPRPPARGGLRGGAARRLHRPAGGGGGRERRAPTRRPCRSPRCPRTATYTRAYDTKPGFLTLVSDGERLTGAHAVGPGGGRVAPAGDARDPRARAARRAVRRHPAVPDLLGGLPARPPRPRGADRRRRLAYGCTGGWCNRQTIARGRSSAGLRARRARRDRAHGAARRAAGGRRGRGRDRQDAAGRGDARRRARAGRRGPAAKAEELEAHRPFGAIVDASRRRGASGWRSSSGWDMRPDAGGERQFSVAETVLELLDGMCARAPVVLAIEDLHWADPAHARRARARRARASSACPPRSS